MYAKNELYSIKIGKLQTFKLVQYFKIFEKKLIIQKLLNLGIGHFNCFMKNQEYSWNIFETFFFFEKYKQYPIYNILLEISDIL